MPSSIPSRRRLACAAVIFIAACPRLARAEDRPAPVGPVVVTATRTATPADELGSSVSVITAETIADHQWRTLPQALMLAPGLSVTQTGGPGGVTSVFIRGLNSGHTKVIVDGVDAEDPSTGGFDFGQELTAGLSRVEILRGPASSLYGSDALGGVINIITAAGSGPVHAEAMVEGGSFATLNQRLSVSGGSSRADFALSLAHQYSGDTPITPRGLLAPGETLIGDRYDNYSLSAKGDLHVARWLSLGLVAHYVMADLRSTGENFAVFPSVPDTAPTDQYQRRLFTRVEARVPLLEGRFQSVFGLGYSYYHTTVQGPDEGFGPPAPTRDNGDRVRLDWQGTLALSSVIRVVGGLDAQRDRLLASPIDASNGRQGGFIELQTRPGGGFGLAGSVRYDHDNRFGGVATWRLAPEWTVPLTGTILRATYGTGFKAPTLAQLYVSFPEFDFFANPALRPERSQGYDLGFEQPLGPVRLGATWFHNIVRDLIDSNADFTSYANIGRATTYGLESFIAWRPSSRLSLRADYTYTFTRDDVAREELLRRPKDKVSLSVDWQATRRLQLAASWIYKGGWVDGSRDFSVPRLWASPYAVMNLAGEYALGKRVTLFARIENLAGRRYEDPVGFDKPGLGAFGGVRFSFGPQ